MSIYRICKVLGSAVAISASVVASNAASQELPKADDILRELRDQPGQRRGAPPSPSAERVLEELITKSQRRGLSEPDLAVLTETTKTLKQIDLTIFFDFNSDAITPKAMPALIELGKAITHPDLKDARILLSGHTDGVGGAAFNQDLSNRRARAVRVFLIQTFQIPAERLYAVGFGKAQLKNPQDPRADENRRVQVVNLDSRRQ